MMEMQRNTPEFILMLTWHDMTVPEALALANSVFHKELGIIGFKDVGLSVAKLSELAQIIRDKGNKVALEVVSVDETDELRSVEVALSLKVDLLLGGTHPEKVVNLIAGASILYFPFVGTVVDHPSKLKGKICEIAGHAEELGGLPGVSGLDLLAYRHEGNAPELMTAVISAVNIPVIVAGSIDSAERIATVVSCGAWGFTVGSAAIDGLFSPRKDSLNHQVAAIIEARNAAVHNGQYRLGVSR